MSLLRALAYELQPFRIRPSLRGLYSSFASSLGRNGDDDDDDDRTQRSSVVASARVLRSLSRAGTSFVRHITSTPLESLRNIDCVSLISNNRTVIAKSAIVLVVLWAYRRLLMYLHDLLSIGPIVLILTLLLLLFTIGLGEDTGMAGTGIPSAYSVFNRGMRRILGTIDGEELARQYAGGMGGGGMGGDMGAANDRDRVVVLNDIHDIDIDDVDRRRNAGIDRRLGADAAINENRRRRRLERLGRREGGDVGAVNDDDGDEAEGSDGDIDGDDYNYEDGNDARRLVRNAAARKKSGKKARRGDLEVRREMQRQRRMAGALGFGLAGEGGGRFHQHR